MIWRRWLLAGLAVWGLGACGTVTDVGEWGERTVLQPLSQVARSMGLGAASEADPCVRDAISPTSKAPGLGGTGAPSVQARPGGLGGTGQVASQRPGLGGTGQVAEGGLGGTGIVGVVTGFGSICVNGLKVEYDPDTPVRQDGRLVPQSALAVGQVVALQARDEGGRLQAQHIAVLDAAVGPLQTLDRSTGRFVVMGQTATALVPSELQDLQPGRWVRVSGQRLASGEIRATRVQTVEPGLAWVAGVLGRHGQGAWHVGGTPLAVAAGLMPNGAEPGQEVGVSGTWSEGVLQVQRLRLWPTRSVLDGADSVVIQGYVHRYDGQDITLGFDTFTLGKLLQVVGGRLDALRSDQPVLVRGRLDERRRLVVDRLEFRQEHGGGGAAQGQLGESREGGTSGGDSAGSGQGRGRGGDSDGQGRGRGRGRGRGGD